MAQEPRADPYASMRWPEGARLSDSSRAAQKCQTSRCVSAIVGETGARGRHVATDLSAKFPKAARSGQQGTLGSSAMPQIGSAIVDASGGLPLVRQWIEQLTCP